MDNFEKSQLIKDDPISCCRYFNHKVAKLMTFLKTKSGIFGCHNVIDSFEKVEFQSRGSAHEHILLWCENVPSYVSNTANKSLISFIDQHVTCKNDSDNPFIKYVKHRHTHTCYKRNRSKKVCRFHFPKFVMKETLILEPLLACERTPNLVQDFKNIRAFHEELFANEQDMTFLEILSKLNITEDAYILAIRSSLKRTSIFLRRNSTEVAINSYNPVILSLFESNIDLQFVFDDYAVANYVVNCMCKCESGLSTLLREVAHDISNGHTTPREKFRKIANVFINSNLMSAQEAAYHCLSLPLSRSSRGFIYINTNPPEERVRLLKSKPDLEKLCPSSEEIFVDDIFKK